LTQKGLPTRRLCFATVSLTVLTQAACVCASGVAKYETETPVVLLFSAGSWAMNRRVALPAERSPRRPLARWNFANGFCATFHVDGIETAKPGCTQVRKPRLASSFSLSSSILPRTTLKVGFATTTWTGADQLITLKELGTYGFRPRTR
jgi:hypothetical protein